MKYLSFLFLILLVACPSAKDEPEEVESKIDVHTEEVTYTSDGVNLKGFLAYDKAVDGQRPGVLVVHEWWGHNEYARNRAQMLAELGYTALAVDMYGEGKTAAHPEDANKFMMEVFNNIKTGEARFLAAMDVLKKHPLTDPEKIAAIGYCFGGAISLHMARIGTDLDGVVSFHGALDSFHKPEPGSIKAKMLVCHGSIDEFVPAEKVTAFKAEMDEAKADYTFIEYEGANHSFTNPSADKFGQDFELPLVYNFDADQKSWQDMKDFFNKIFAE